MLPYTSINFGTIQTQFEYTSTNTQTVYDQAMGVINGIGVQEPTSITSTDVTNFNTALQNLMNLTTSTGSNTITASMARGIDALLNSIKAVVGSVTPFSSSDLSEILQWKDLYLQGIGSVLQTAALLGSSAATTSLQGFIQLEYIHAGNDQLYAELSTLQQALKATQAAAKLLTQIQNLKNGTLADANGNVVTYLSVEERNPSPATSAWVTGQIPTTRASLIPAHYNSAGSPFFSGPLKVIFKGTNVVNTLETSGLDLLRQLTTVIDQLEAVNPSPPGGNPQSLQAQLISIRSAMVGNGTNTNHPILQWILDNYDVGTVTLPDNAGTLTGGIPEHAGDFQKDLSKAVNLTTSQNDALSVQIQKALFITQEFYESAQRMMTTLHNIIRTMAQKAK